MEMKDILGDRKVRTKAEYTARTHWAASINFDAIFTAPILYVFIPVLLLCLVNSLTELFFIESTALYLTNEINGIIKDAELDIAPITIEPWMVVAFVAVLLWQFVVCWTVWSKQIKNFKNATRYEYLFFNDIVEYKVYDASEDTTPKFIKRVKFLISLVPNLIVVGILGYLGLTGYDHYVEYIQPTMPEPTPPSTSNPTPSTPNPGTGTSRPTTPTPGTGSTTPSTPGSGTSGNKNNLGDALENIWDGICEVLGNIGEFITDNLANILKFLLAEENKPVVTVTGWFLLGALALIVLINFVSNREDYINSIPPKELDPMTLKARTLPAIITATKMLPAPSFSIPKDCPYWLKKLIFWAPVHYNFGDVVISSPKGLRDDLVLSKIENPEKLLDYLVPLKPKPTEGVTYSANRKS